MSSSPACTRSRKRATADGSAVGTPWRSIWTAQNVPRSWLRSSSRASCRAGVESATCVCRSSGRVGPGVEPVTLGEEADQRVQGGRYGVAVVGEQRHGAREPHREGVGDVGARPVAEAPVQAVLVVQRGRDQRRFHREAATAGPRHDVQPQPVPDDGVRLQVLGAEDELHRGTLPAAGARCRAGVAGKGDQGGGIAGYGDGHARCTGGAVGRTCGGRAAGGPGAVAEPAAGAHRRRRGRGELPGRPADQGPLPVQARAAVHAGLRGRGHGAGGAGRLAARAGRPGGRRSAARARSPRSPS